MHMEKIRKKILDVQKIREKRDTNKRLRDEKKFALKSQKFARENKQKQKKKFMEAVKKYRKGMKMQLDTVVNDSKYNEVVFKKT